MQRTERGGWRAQDQNEQYESISGNDRSGHDDDADANSNNNNDDDSDEKKV